MGVPADPLILSQRSRIVRFAVEHRIPAMYEFREFVSACAFPPDQIARTNQELNRSVTLFVAKPRHGTGTVRERVANGTGGQRIGRHSRRRQGPDLLARDVIIVAGDGQENEVEFHQLLDDLYDDHEPVGPIEHMLVQNMAVNRWRKWRVLRAEMGAIRALLDNVTVERARALADKVKSQEDNEEGYDHLRRSSAGIDVLLGGIDAIRE